jgi:hypothetical protein
MPTRIALREALGELIATTLLLAVMFLSGLVHVQLGTGPAAGAILGSMVLGFGYGLVIWTFGEWSGAPVRVAHGLDWR